MTVSSILTWRFVLQLAAAIMMIFRGTEQPWVQGVSTPGGSVFPSSRLNTTISEVEILLDFRRRVLKDPTAAFSSWNWNDSSPCAWEGVMCDSRRRVNALVLPDRELQGTLSAMLGGLLFISKLDLSGNHFEGIIPPEFGGMSSMKELDLVRNQLSGPIPASLGNLSRMQRFALRENKLTGELPPSLGEFSDMTFFGIIPPSLGNCRNLIFLDLFENDLSGPILSSLGNLTKLQRINLGSNRISGPIPPEISSCTALASVTLSNNLISGTIPDSVGKIRVALKTLRLDGNRLTGPMPLGLIGTKDLQTSDLSHNLLSGRIPAQVMTTLGLSGLSLNLSHNNFSGPIPPTIGKLEQIDLSMNHLVGAIPPSRRDCKGLGRLDLSSNSLEGSIPESLGSLHYLSYFNVSNNQLTGSIPDHGSFRNFTEDSYLGNAELCGSVLGKICPSSVAMIMSSCKGPADCKLGMISGLTVSLAFALVTFWLCLWYRCRPPSIKVQDEFKHLTFFDERYSSKFEEIWQAIDNVRNHGMFLGRGGNSTVYRVELSESQTVAIKILRAHDENNVRRNLKPMVRELQILGQVRHRNLVKLLGVSCKESFNALIFEYMANGNLSSWLHGSRELGRTLDWQTRLQVAIGVASALAYLHHDHDAGHPIVHRDLKPSNILLNADFVAKVSDFGLAKIIEETTDPDLQSTASTTLSYTTGYCPPEYGTSFRSSTKGDVYAFGIILMELLTGTQPTDARFGLEMNIVKWVRDGFPEALMAVLDNNLQADSQNLPVDRQIRNVTLLAIICTEERPQLRPSMQDVLSVLMDIRNDCLGAKLRPVQLQAATLPTFTVAQLTMSTSATTLFRT